MEYILPAKPPTNKIRNGYRYSFLLKIKAPLRGLWVGFYATHEKKFATCSSVIFQDKAKDHDTHDPRCQNNARSARMMMYKSFLFGTEYFLS